ncbi:MAG: septum formation initiator family protein [Candidatus Daviesbacteria bacterium]|nr:septum formation initiator family protein [Candidatus Daviesbacteria bacterium]
MNKKLIIVAAGVIILAVLYSLGRQISDAMLAGNRLDQASLELSELQKKNNELQDKLKEVQTVGFIEREARDKLNLAREKETVVVIPDSEINRILGLYSKVEEIKLPNWQGWLKLFFP